MNMKAYSVRGGNLNVVRKEVKCARKVCARNKRELRVSCLGAKDGVKNSMTRTAGFVRKNVVSLPSKSVVVRAAEVTDEVKAFVPPPLDPNTPSPIFGGGTGGLLRKAQVEEFYVVTWEGKKEQIFEMPTGGSAIMRQGGNLLKQAKKEHCLALVTQLRTKFKIDGRIYRVFPSGEVQYLHPKDGVYPEKVNKGRVATNTNDRSIGQNKNPSEVKFTGKNAFEI